MTASDKLVQAMRDKFRRFRKETKTLKDALYRTIHHNKRYKLEQIAEALDMAPSYLYRSATPDPDTDPGSSGVRFPLKQLAPLTRFTGDFQVLDQIEHSLGRVGFEVPVPEDCSIETLQLHAINTAAEFGDLMREFNDGIKDHVLQPDDKDKIWKEGYESIQATLLFLMAVDMENGNGGCDKGA